MKINKRQLRRIIKEEKRKLREALSQEDALFRALDEYVMALDEEMGYDIDPEQLKAEVYNFVDGYFEDTAHAAKQYQEEENLDGLAESANPSPVVNSYTSNMKRARADKNLLADMAELWDAMIAAPGDIEHARAIADSLGLSPALASFHARKIKEGDVYPTGGELQLSIESLPAPSAPAPRPRKPYGGGSKYRPWDRST